MTELIIPISQDQELSKLDCFIEDKTCGQESKTKGAKFLFKYLTDNGKTITTSFNNMASPPKLVTGEQISDIYTALSEQKDIINGQLDAGINMASLKESLTNFDKILERIYKEIIKDNQHSFFYTESPENFKKYVFKGEHRLWAEFIPTILTDIFRTCIMIVNEKQPCQRLYPFIDSNQQNQNNVRNTRERSLEINKSLQAVLPEIKSPSQYDNTQPLTETMKNFLRHAAKIFNFAIETFFDETQTRINDTFLIIDDKNDEDLKFLAEFLFTHELPCEIDDNDKITYRFNSEGMNSENMNFKKQRGHLFLYVIKLLRLLQQLLLSSINPLNLLMFYLGYMHQLKYQFGISSKELKYFYDKKTKKIYCIQQQNIQFVEHMEYGISLPLSYLVLQQSLDISNDLEIKFPLYFDLLSNNDSFFQSLGAFLKTPSFDKIQSLLGGKGVSSGLSVNDLNSSSSNTSSSNTSSAKLIKSDNQAISDLLFNNEFHEKLFNLSNLFYNNSRIITNYNQQIQAVIASDAETGIDKQIGKRADTQNIDLAFHTCLTYSYDIQIKTQENHRKTFFDLIRSLMKHLSNPETNKAFDFVLVVDIESVDLFLQTFYRRLTSPLEMENTYVISFVRQMTGSYSIYLGNNDESLISMLLNEILNENNGEFSDFIEKLNKNNLFIVVTNVNINFVQVPRKTEEYNKVGETKFLLTRFSQSVPYVKSVIEESFQMNNMVTILVQNCQNKETYNERINFFAKLLCIHFLKSKDIYKEACLNWFYQACLFLGLFMIQNPDYFPQFEWERYIPGNRTGEQKLIQRIRTSFEDHKTELYKCIPSILHPSNQGSFDGFKERYVNNFASKSLVDFIRGRQTAQRGFMSGFRRGGGRKTKKSTKLNKPTKHIQSNKSIKKMMKKINKNQSRKRSNIYSNNKSKKLKPKKNKKN